MNCDMSSLKNVEAPPFKTTKIICFDGEEKNPADCCALHGFASEKVIK